MFNLLQLLGSPDVNLCVRVEDGQPMLLGDAGFAFSCLEFGEYQPFSAMAQYEVGEACSACGDVSPGACHGWLGVVAVPAVYVGQPFDLLQE